MTDFTLIRPGALHQANGGFLMLDARRVLQQPFAWEALKRMLRAGEIRIQSPYEEIGLVSTVSLEPEPIPLDVKVVLLGDRWNGHSSTDIAERLDLSVKTVESYRARLKTKLNLDSATELARHAMHWAACQSG